MIAYVYIYTYNTCIPIHTKYVQMYLYIHIYIYTCICRYTSLNPFPQREAKAPTAGRAGTGPRAADRAAAMPGHGGLWMDPKAQCELYTI